MSKTMSRRELDKWGNKLRLWMVLHPGIDPRSARMCYKCCAGGVQECRKLLSSRVLSWDGDKIDFVDSGDETLNGGQNCVEWVSAPSVVFPWAAPANWFR